MRERRLFTTLVLLAGLARAAAAETTVTGTVTDSATGAPLAGVAVSVAGTRLRAVTDFGGRYRVEGVPEGTASLTFERVGYLQASHTVEVGPGGAVSLGVVLVATPVYMDQLVVTASKGEDEQRQSTQTLNALTATDFDTLDVETLSDGLDFLPSITTFPNQVSIRGSEGLTRDSISRVLLLVDGIPLVPADNIGIPIEMIPPEIIQRVEVLKGPGSALYGPSAMAGVVNVITREPSIEPWTTADLYFGIFDDPKEQSWKAARETQSFFGLSATHSGRLGERVNGLLSVRHDGSDGYQERASSDETLIYSSLAYNRDRSQFRLLLGYTDQDRLEFYNWQDKDHPFIEGNFPPEWQWELFKNRWVGGGLWSQALSERVYYTARGRYYRVRHTDDFVNTADVGQSFHFQDSDAELLGLDLTSWFDVGNRLSTSLGLDLQDDSMESDVFGPHGSETVAPYLQFSYAMAPRVQLEAGLRHDRDKEDELDAVARTSPNAGVTIDFGRYGALRAFYGEGFILPGLDRFLEETQVTPTVIVRGAPDLQPEESRSVEIGYSWSRADRLFANLAAFYTWYDNLIQKISFREGNFIIETKGNVAEATLKGVEAQIGFRRGLGAGSALRGTLNYGYLDSWDKQGRHPLDYRSKHTASGAAVWTRGLYEAGFDYKFRSQAEFTPSPPFPDADLKIDSKQFDLHLACTFGQYKAMLTVGNLFQDRYLARAGWQGPPRFFKLGLQIRP